MSLHGALDGMYTIGETIGSGGFGKVKKGVHVLSGETVAIKIMNKKKLGIEASRVQIEIEALKQLKHQNICQLYQVVETEENFYLILEYCPNGELFDYIVTRDRLDEDSARFFFGQIVSAVAYIHSQGYAHRDLKPENLLLDDKGNLKLIDFGLCVKPMGGLGAHVSTCCGSPSYAAPELLSGKLYLGREADIWSLGVLLYALLCGFLPFEDSNTALLFRKIQVGKFVTPVWLSSASSDLIHKMLQTDPNIRIKMSSLIRHPWITNSIHVPLLWHSTIKNSQLDSECIDILKQHYKMSSEEIMTFISQSEHDYLTATYKILLHMKCLGKNINTGLHKSSRSKSQGNKENDNSLPGNPSKNEIHIKLPNCNYLGSPKFELERKRESANVFNKRDCIVRSDKISKLSNESMNNNKTISKKNVPDQHGKKVKWIIPKIPNANCMRGCNLDTVGDETDHSFPNNIKCCGRDKRYVETEANEFFFVDYRKRKLEHDDSYEKGKIDAIISKSIKNPDIIYNLSLSPRTSDRPGKSSSTFEAHAVHMKDLNKKNIDLVSPRKLTRWKNNQRRKAPVTRYLGPASKMATNAIDVNEFSSSSGCSESDNSKNSLKRIKPQPPEQSDRPCRRVCEWVQASCSTDEDENIMKMSKKSLSDGYKTSSKQSQSSFDDKESSNESKTSKNVKIKHFHTEKYDPECSINKKVPKEHLKAAQQSQWKSEESGLDILNVHQRNSGRNSASVEMNLNHLQSIKGGIKNDRKTTIIDNLGKGMDRLIGMLTPRKKDYFHSEARKLKAGHNINATNHQEVGPALLKLKDVLDKKGVLYRERGFNLRCFILDRCNQVTLSFNLEVVQVDEKSVGICHKRLTGDIWHYKRLCNSIFKQANM